MVASKGTINLNANDIQLDDEFDKILPSLTENELSQLEFNILNDGEIRDPVTIWKQEGLLIDGYNRVRIAIKHRMPVEVRELCFDSRTSVLVWIGNNAKGRRNLTESQRKLYIGNWYRAIKRQDGGHGDQTTPQSYDHIKALEGKTAAEFVAEKTGVSVSTVQRAGDMSENVEKLSAPIRHDIETGETELSQKDILTLAELPKRKQRQVIASVKKGEVETIQEAAPKKTKENPSALDRMKEWNKGVEGIIKEVKSAAHNVPDGPWFDASRLAIFNSQIESACATMRWSKCTDICPRCDGKGCKICHDTGFMNKQTFDMRSDK